MQWTQAKATVRKAWARKVDIGIEGWRNDVIISLLRKRLHIELRENVSAY
jgi:hypothetical protein